MSNIDVKELSATSAMLTSKKYGQCRQIKIDVGDQCRRMVSRHCINIVYICIHVDDIGKEISFGHECSDTHQLFTDNLGRTFGGFGFGIFLTANGLLVKGHIIGWNSEDYMT